MILTRKTTSGLAGFGSLRTRFLAIFTFSGHPVYLGTYYIVSTKYNRCFYQNKFIIPLYKSILPILIPFLGRILSADSYISIVQWSTTCIIIFSQCSPIGTRIRIRPGAGGWNPFRRWLGVWRSSDMSARTQGNPGVAVQRTGDVLTTLIEFWHRVWNLSNPQRATVSGLYTLN